MGDSFKVGQKVEVVGKEVQGVIAYIGVTEFASGRWIGLVLDVPKGKNNGTVKGKEYFKCEDNFGMFVKASQVVRLDDKGNPMETSSDSVKLRSRQSAVRRKTSPTKRPGTLSASSSRISLASSRQSLASSRQSLAGSRQSLAGSRSQLASPNVERTEGVEGGGSQIPTKRASFVETNFVETLKPQFTPGQAITSTTTPIAASVEDKLSALQYQQEIENREQQIRDLSEKNETLKIKRHEDKERTKDYDKLKIQLEQLLEFKQKIMESQQSLQRDLQRAKQEAKEAIDAREAHAEEVADLADSLEMATLDKEMAEEKAEALQLELEACKEKLEEVTLDLEILKTEMQDKGGNIGDGTAVSSYEVKQLEQQNARLREALVRMRDLSAHDKHEYQKLLKDMDQKKSEIAELGRTKEKLSTRVEQMEQQISDLQEQVDTALGAEEMVFILGEQKLSLEEKVTQLQEEVAELEALQEVNEQLLESNAEMEADLREELDMAYAAQREALREKEAALETIADRESTINKFRDLVQKLREQSLDLQTRLENESSKPVGALPEILDFKKMFTETKAHTKAIDLELRRIDVQQLQQHIRYLTAFMPDNFMNRGGDHDAVLVLLLIPRMIYKTDLLLTQIRDKFPPVEVIDRNVIIKAHSVEQFSFRCRLSYYIYALQAVLRQYEFCLATCKSETLLNVGASYTEMAAQEKVIDGLVELVKRSQLDENVQTELLEKCVAYFYTMYPLQLNLEKVENRLNHLHLLNDNVKMLNAVMDGIHTDANVLKHIVDTAHAHATTAHAQADIPMLFAHCISTSASIQASIKLIKRRIPVDLGGYANIGLNKEIFENLYQCYQHAGKVLKTLQDVARNGVKFLSTSGEVEKGVPLDKMKDLAINASDKIYEQDDLGPVQSIKNSLQFISTQITQLAQFLQDNEYEINTTRKDDKGQVQGQGQIQGQAYQPSQSHLQGQGHLTGQGHLQGQSHLQGQGQPQGQTVPTVILRASQVKKELEQTKTLTNKLEIKESDIKELKKAVKDKQEQLSEMTIRKELAEKKLGNVNKDYEMTIEKLNRKLEESQTNEQRLKKEFEKTMDYMQADIESLESEKNAMKDKLKLISRSGAGSGAGGEGGKLGGGVVSGMDPKSLEPTLPQVVKDSPLLLQEIEHLKGLFACEREERMRLQSAKMLDVLNGLRPLPRFRQRFDGVVEGLYKEGAALKQEILLTLAMPKFPSIYKLQPDQRPNGWQRHFAEKQAKLLRLRTKAEAFQRKVMAESVRRKFGAQVESDFTVFPTTEMKKAFDESKPVNIGFVQLPKEYAAKNQKSSVINLELDFQNLQNILNTLTK